MKLLTADTKDKSGDQLAALDTKAEAQPTDVHPEVHGCEEDDDFGTIKVREAFANNCRTENDCCEFLEFQDGDSEAEKEDSKILVQEFFCILSVC